MSFSIELTEDAEKDIEKFKKTGNKKILENLKVKIYCLIPNKAFWFWLLSDKKSLSNSNDLNLWTDDNL